MSKILNHNSLGGLYSLSMYNSPSNELFPMVETHEITQLLVKYLSALCHPERNKRVWILTEKYRK